MTRINWCIPALALALLLPGTVTADNALTVSGGLAVYDNDYLDDVIFGPTLVAYGRLENGLHLRAEGMRLEGETNSRDRAKANRGEVELGYAQRANPWFDVLLGVEVTHIDPNWTDSRTETGAMVGFRGENDGLETEIHALYRYPDSGSQSPQAGARLRTGGIHRDTGWGIGIGVTWLTDEQMASALVHRRF